MTDFPLRRAQLVAPAGPGSIQTSTEGISGMICGIDHWIDLVDAKFNFSEFKIVDEWRLADELGVDYFVRPPDYREPVRFQPDDDERNLYIKLPAVRFPRAHFCRKCYRLVLEESSHLGGPLWCEACAENPGKRKGSSPLIQMAFVIMCDNGHIEDFPYREWVHRTASPKCDGQLTVSLSGATLESQSVRCSCGASRSFGRIFEGAGDDPNGPTFLSAALEPGEKFMCRGRQPWLDQFENGAPCDRFVVGSLSGAVNVYYPYIESALFLPKEVAGVNADLMDALHLNGPQVLLTLMRDIPTDLLATLLKEREAELLGGFTIEEIRDAVDQLRAGRVTSTVDEVDDWRLRLKAPEYKVLLEGASSMPSMLKLSTRDIGNYDNQVSGRISAITLVDRLRETRALTGFGRVKPNPHIAMSEKKALLRRPNTQPRDWLPAYEVFGEGIFLDFNGGPIHEWSNHKTAQSRCAIIGKSRFFARDFPNSQDPTYLPRLMMIHTLSHILINQLVFDCGYTAASLRERIYCSDNQPDRTGMNGVLIYTASGDSEGSMGGLVRMGEAGVLDRVFEAAIDNARFCSSDPVCMELGERGQGPDSMNLAACHSCGIVPETSCELFNKYLDRALLIGTTSDPSLGFFN